MRYNPEISNWKKCYCFGHFLLLLAVFFHFEYDRYQLCHLDFILKLAFFFTTMQCLGAFFDRKFVNFTFIFILSFFKSNKLQCFNSFQKIIGRLFGKITSSTQRNCCTSHFELFGWASFYHLAPS